MTTNKEIAAKRRELADCYAKLAEALRAVGHHQEAEGAETKASTNRTCADRIDPPAPVWEHGAFALDRCGDLWQYDAGEEAWSEFTEARLITDDLTANYGPLTPAHVVRTTQDDS